MEEQDFVGNMPLYAGFILVSFLIFAALAAL